MYGALSYSWYLEDKRGGGCFEVITSGANADHEGGEGNFNEDL